MLTVSTETVMRMSIKTRLYKTKMHQRIGMVTGNKSNINSNKLVKF